METWQALDQRELLGGGDPVDVVGQEVVSVKLDDGGAGGRDPPPARHTHLGLVRHALHRPSVVKRRALAAQDSSQTVRGLSSQVGLRQGVPTAGDGHHGTGSESTIDLGPRRRSKKTRARRYPAQVSQETRDIHVQSIANRPLWALARSTGSLTPG